MQHYIYVCVALQIYAALQIKAALEKNVALEMLNFLLMLLSFSLTYLYMYTYSRKVLLSNVYGMSAISSTYLTLLRMTSSPSSYATWQNYDVITFFLRNVTKSWLRHLLTQRDKIMTSAPSSYAIRNVTKAWRRHLLLTQRDKIMTSSPPSYATWQNHDVISFVLHNLLNCCCFQDGM